MAVVAADGGLLTAFDVRDGREIWRTDPRHDRGSPISGSPLFAGDKIIVPISATDVATAMRPNHECCKTHGALAAVDAATGKRLWIWHTMEDAKPLGRKSSTGAELYGPSGAPIWSSPAADLRRGVAYASTGENTSPPGTRTSDAIVAVDLATGKEKWVFQALANDIWHMGCPVGAPRPGQRVNPTCFFVNEGSVLRDHDFGAGPVIFRGRGGRDIILAGQKSGEMYGLNPVNGEVIWKTRVGAGSSLGGIEWGIAADDRYVYAPNSDIGGLMEIANRRAGRPMLADQWFQQPRPGVTALAPLSGRIVWHTPTPQAPCQMYGDRSRDRAQGCFPASSAAPMVIPGALFAGSTDGWLRAYDADNGRIIWEFSTTAQRYNTTNGVQGQPGGSIDSMGPTAAMGMVFVMSGYNGAANVGGNGTNVLLAFSPDGK